MTVDLPVPALEVEKHSQPLQRRSYRSDGSPPSSSASSTSSLFSADAFSLSSRSSVCSIISSFHSTANTSVNHKSVEPWSLNRRSQTFPPPSDTSPLKLGHLTLPPIGTDSCAAPAALEHRQHPRRSSTVAKQWQPPSLVRQSERKGNFVDKLVGEWASLGTCVAL